MHAVYCITMTNIDKALEYLTDYSQKTKPIYDEMLDELSARSKEVGKLPFDVMTKFRDIAKGGKRLRGSLVTLGFELAGGEDNSDILSAGLIQELVHSAILVDDDVMDGSSLRRGEPTIHTIFSEGVAMCLSDSVYFFAFEKMLDLKFPTEDLRIASKYYSESISNLGFGQMLDIATTVTQQSEDDILKMLWLKSGEYSVHTPLRFGALLAGSKDKDWLDNLKGYAKSLGWAFQISDDLLGSFGETDKTGKPTDSDIREGKNTLLVLHVRKHGTETQKEVMEKYLGKPNLTEHECNDVVQVFIESGARKALEVRLTSLVSEGKTYIPNLTQDVEQSAVLNGLLDYMLVRES